MGWDWFDVFRVVMVVIVAGLAARGSYLMGCSHGGCECWDARAERERGAR